MIRTRFAPCLALACLLCSAQAISAPIENPNSDTVSTHQHSTLKPVAKLIIKGNTLCTGTWLGPNTLLTARHCVVDEEKSEPVPFGTSLIVDGRLGSIENYAFTPIQDSSESTDIGGEDEASFAFKPQARSNRWSSPDLAVILFKPRRCDSKIRVSYARIATPSESYLGDRIHVIAGYGNSKRDRPESSETLNAGHAYGIFSGFFHHDFGRKIAEFLSKSGMSTEKKDRTKIWLFGLRNIESEWHTARTHQSLRPSIKPRQDTFSHRYSLPLPGDSGGPWFAFDDRMEPVQTAVTSYGYTEPYLDYAEPVHLARSSSGKTHIFKRYPFIGRLVNPNATPELSLEALDVLIQEGFLDHSHHALQDFSVVTLRKVIDKDVGTALFEPGNSAFIQDSLEKLNQIRQEKRFCE